MAAARASTSPPVIHRPVVSEISTRSGRNARTTAAVAAGSSVSWPSASRGWAWIETAPALMQARASAASSSGVSGTPASRSPFRQAWRIHATGADTAASNAAQIRNVQRVPTSGISASAATKLPTSPPAVDSAYSRPVASPATATERTLSRIAHGDSAPSTSTGGPTSTSSASSEPDSSSSESSVTPSSGIATSGISATSAAPSSAARAIPGLCGCRSASRPPTQ